MATIKFASGSKVSFQGKTVFSASLDGGGDGGEGGGADIFWSGWSTEPQFTDSPSGTVTSDGVSNLEISDRTALTSFNVNYLSGPQNVGGTVDASGCINLIDLQFQASGITSIDVSGCTKLQILNLEQNQLTGALDLSGLTSLNYLYFYGDGFTSLDISDTAMFLMNIVSLPNLTTITLNNVTTLNYVYTFAGFGGLPDTINLSIATKEALLASCVAAYNSGNAGYGYIDFVGDSSLLSPQAQADFQTLQNAGWMAV